MLASDNELSVTYPDQNISKSGWGMKDFALITNDVETTFYPESPAAGQDGGLPGIPGDAAAVGSV